MLVQQACSHGQQQSDRRRPTVNLEVLAIKSFAGCLAQDLVAFYQSFIVSGRRICNCYTIAQTYTSYQDKEDYLHGCQEANGPATVSHCVLHVLYHTKNVTYRVTIFMSQVLRWPLARALHYAMFTAIVIVAGCAARSELSELWPPFIVKYAGDTLWALMLYVGLGFLLPGLRTGAIALAVLVFSFSVEFSQLYHAPWIDSFRGTLIGAVALGSDFLWSDLLCYIAGCGIGVIGEASARVLRQE